MNIHAVFLIFLEFKFLKCYLYLIFLVIISCLISIFNIVTVFALTEHVMANNILKISQNQTEKWLSYVIRQLTWLSSPLFNV